MNTNYLWMLLILSLALFGKNYHEAEQINRGKAISQFVAYYHDIDLTPQEARWINPVVTTYNITLEELNVLPAYAPIQRKGIK